MSTMTWTAVAMAVVLIAAIGFVVLRRRRQHLRRRFGPEYEHALNQRDSRSEAEQELRAREKRFATLDITPLTPESRQSYAGQWTRLQQRFVDAPGAAVTEADELVTAAMAERGYPTGGFRQQLADLSVVHGRTLHHYRQAHEISGRATSGEASTEDLRQAMVHYRALFEELLDDAEVPSPRPVPVEKHEKAPR
ncbi:LPXTG cell wall anchor domain-containing protein [Nonomuraea sp. LPB2021202275-12-8]|uniref:LPXTG cell wall anchor domain-containing protein n=1 Tax=Nonomuraea sp. LPB2021202275-12-8 TaxID=3120159 RepID=UPI00300C84FC